VCGGHIPGILKALERLLADVTAGDPASGMKWTHRSLRTLRKGLRHLGIKASPPTIARLLHGRGFSLRTCRKNKAGTHDKDRDRQFRYLVRLRKLYLGRGWPVISVDTKKKELVGEFKNPGRCWRREARDVLDHDFPSWATGRAVPYGIYDVAFNDGMVVVGTSHETPSFAVAAIRRWWLEVGRRRYARTRRLLIEADAGGANDARKWEWKVALQGLADEFGLTITVTHYPTGASKWNPIDHRMFSLISANWSGEPLVNYETILGYIRRTRSGQGFHCRARLDRTVYPKRSKATTEAKNRVRLKRRRVLPKWNYTIRPHDKPPEC
jgi:Rhodopirellula transposase DDE domain